jgi:hypothetical protein
MKGGKNDPIINLIGLAQPAHLCIYSSIYSHSLPLGVGWIASRQ